MKNFAIPRDAKFNKYRWSRLQIALVLIHTLIFILILIPRLNNSVPLSRGTIYPFWFSYIFLIFIVPILLLLSSSFLRSKTKVFALEDAIYSVLCVGNFRYILTKVAYSEVDFVRYKTWSLWKNSKQVINYYFVLNRKTYI